MKKIFIILFIFILVVNCSSLKSNDDGRIYIDVYIHNYHDETVKLNFFIKIEPNETIFITVIKNKEYCAEGEVTGEEYGCHTFTREDEIWYI